MRRWQQLLWLLSTAAAAAIIVAAVNAATEYTPYEQALIDTSNSQPCFPFCGGGLPSTPGGPGGTAVPTATAVATATNTPVPTATATPDPRITAIQDLPLQGETSTYNAGVVVCADGDPSACR